MDPSDPNSRYDDSGVPVFEPSMEQFSDFYRFCESVDEWGMKRGIVKIVPPKEWLDMLPSIRAADVAQEEAKSSLPSGSLPTLEGVRIKSAISQHFGPAAKPGLWRQTNITRPAMIWNVKQWASLCNETELRGPTMKGIRDLIKNRDRMSKGEPGAGVDDEGIRTRSGRVRAGDSKKGEASSSRITKKRQKRAVPKQPVQPPPETTGSSQVGDETSALQVLSSLADSSPKARDLPATDPDQSSAEPKTSDHTTSSIKAEAVPSSPRELAAPLKEEDQTSDHPDIDKVEDLSESTAVIPSSKDAPAPKPKPAKVKTAELTTPEEWAEFDFRRAWLQEWKAADAQDEETAQPSDWTPEVCREIEGEYWRGLNFGKSPMYGADLKGSLFTPSTKSWNVGSLDNLLTRLKLKKKIAGVTDPYLYFGMWRATFAWHVEDMDLYSINYIHFGAPKQWYAIAQKDRLRFETALSSSFPGEAQRCSQFMRHKLFLASPSFLSAHNIRPIKCVQHAGEFIITYPFGYHSGYNLGFNCAESVNFALESWLDIGRKAKVCACQDAQESVQMDVDALLEESAEMEELMRKREERERLRIEKEKAGALDEETKRKRRETGKRKREAAQRLKEARAAEGGDADADDVDGRPSKKARQATLGETEAGIMTVNLHELPCAVCPGVSQDGLMPIAASPEAETSNAKGKTPRPNQAHVICAAFIPETWVGANESTGQDEIKEFHNISKARMALKCSLCPDPALAKWGCCIQCTYGSCSKSAHPMCAQCEQSGWQVEYMAPSQADQIEGRDKKGKGKGKNKKQASQQPTTEHATAPAVDVAVTTEETSQSAETTETTSAEEPQERLVVLCRQHNPIAKAKDALRRVEALRQSVRRLEIGSLIKVKANGSGAIWDVFLVALKDGVSSDVEGEALVTDASASGLGKRYAVKWSKIIFDTDATNEDNKVIVDHGSAAHTVPQAKFSSWNEWCDAKAGRTPSAPLVKPVSSAPLPAPASTASETESLQTPPMNWTTPPLPSGPMVPRAHAPQYQPVTQYQHHNPWQLPWSYPSYPSMGNPLAGHTPYGAIYRHPQQQQQLQQQQQQQRQGPWPTYPQPVAAPYAPHPAAVNGYQQSYYHQQRQQMEQQQRYQHQQQQYVGSDPNSAQRSD